MDPKDKAELDQSQRFMTDYLPSLWWGLYENMIEHGFDKDQAERLLHTYIKTANAPSPKEE